MQTIYVKIAVHCIWFIALCSHLHCALEILCSKNVRTRGRMRARVRVHSHIMER